MSSRGARVFRRVVMIIAILVAVTYPALYFGLLARGHHRPDLLLDALLGAFAGGFLWYADRSQTHQANACPACAGALRRTRSPGGARYWTCSACGYERLRKNPRPRAGRGSTPRSGGGHGDFMRTPP